MKNLSALLALSLSTAAISAQHVHWVIGADSQDQGAQLQVINPEQFTSPSQIVHQMPQAGTGTYAGYYHASSPLIVAAATPDHGGPEFGAPALGSFIEVRIVSVLGPKGGEFAFWESGATSPTIMAPVGIEEPTALIPLTESNRSPASDPYGHIHGRRFTVNKPGLYRVYFHAIDTSTHGENGGPIHEPADVFAVMFQAGQTLSILDVRGDLFLVFAAAANQNLVVEANSSLAMETDWEEMTDIIVGQGLIVREPIPSAEAIRFFRLKTVE